MSTHSSSHSSVDQSFGQSFGTLKDWLRQKKNDFNPEKRILGFRLQAEQSMANDNFEDALNYYSKAIELCPNDSHLFANRSYCHKMLSLFDLCLSDSQKAIDLSEQSITENKDKQKNSKDLAKYRNKLMFYQKGMALKALKRFQESIDALVLSKSLAISCHFIDNEIKDIKLDVICDLGYDRSDVEMICNSFDSLEQLIKQLNQNKQLMIDNNSVDQLPSNPFKYRGLYVNGLSADCDNKQLEELLSTCGQLIRCKVYSNGKQSKAIISFDEHQSCREAIRVIRSNKQFIHNQSVEELVFRYRHNCIDDGTDLRTDPQIHFKGTEIGGECYKWRTTGCDNKDCKALHIPLCHHLDQQSVQTDIVKQKRQTIVFDVESNAESTPLPNKSLKISDKNVIKFDINSGSEAKNHNSSLNSSKSIRTRISFDLEDDTKTNGTQMLSPIKKICLSDKKVIRLNSRNESEIDNSDLSLDSTKTVRSSGRKRIVFDLDMAPDSPTNGTHFTKIKTPVTPTPPPSDRSVTSYDDLF